MGNPVFVAYIYTQQSGLLERVVVSDDCADEQTLRATHLAPGEDALVSTRSRITLTDPVDIAKALKSEDEIQGAINAATGIIPPPKKPYALLDAGGKVLDIIQSRTPVDIHTLKHDAFQNEIVSVSQRADVVVGDVINSDGSVTKVKDPNAFPEQGTMTIADLQQSTERELWAFHGQS